MQGKEFGSGLNLIIDEILPYQRIRFLETVREYLRIVQKNIPEARLRGVD